MRGIGAYQCADGSVHLDEGKAKAHEDDLLGQELEGLLRLFKLNLTRSQEYKGLLSVMMERGELLNAIESIARVMNHSDEE